MACSLCRVLLRLVVVLVCARVLTMRLCVYFRRTIQRPLPQHCLFGREPLFFNTPSSLTPSSIFTRKGRSRSEKKSDRSNFTQISTHFHRISHRFLKSLATNCNRCPRAAQIIRISNDEIPPPVTRKKAVKKIFPIDFSR